MYIVSVVRTRVSLVYIWHVDDLSFTTFVHMANNYYSIYGKHVFVYCNYITCLYISILHILMAIQLCRSHIIIFQKII